jgi:hypothetical protein
MAVECAGGAREATDPTIQRPAAHTHPHNPLSSLSLFFALVAAAGAAVKSTYPHTPPHLALKPSCHVCGIFEGCFRKEGIAQNREFDVMRRRRGRLFIS